VPLRAGFCSNKLTGVAADEPNAIRIIARDAERNIDLPELSVYIAAT
jgi:hypothetical protein